MLAYSTGYTVMIASCVHHRYDSSFDFACIVTLAASAAATASFVQSFIHAQAPEDRSLSPCMPQWAGVEMLPFIYTRSCEIASCLPVGASLHATFLWQGPMMIVQVVVMILHVELALVFLLPSFSVSVLSIVMRSDALFAGNISVNLFL